MGKVHRIKRRFWRVVSGPLDKAWYPLLGRRFDAVLNVDRYLGSRAVLRPSVWESSRAYRPLVRHLIHEYEEKTAEAVVGHTDTGPVKG